MRRFPLAALFLALALAGCAERVLGPGDVAGSYVLYRYDGAPPPRSYVDQSNCAVTVYGGGLTLGADGSYALDLERGRQCPGVQALQSVGLSASGIFRVVDGVLRFADGTGAFWQAGALVGTHVRLSVPQPAGLSPGQVTVEFAAGARSEITAVGDGGNTGIPPLPPPPADTTSSDSGIVIILKP